MAPVTPIQPLALIPWWQLILHARTITNDTDYAVTMSPIADDFDILMAAIFPALGTATRQSGTPAQTVMPANGIQFIQTTATAAAAAAILAHTVLTYGGTSAAIRFVIHGETASVWASYTSVLGLQSAVDTAIGSPVVVSGQIVPAGNPIYPNNIVLFNDV